MFLPLGKTNEQKDEMKHIFHSVLSNILVSLINYIINLMNLWLKTDPGLAETKI